MLVENIQIDMPVQVALSGGIFQQYLQKNGWNHEPGVHNELWRHKDNKAPLLDLSDGNLKRSLEQLATHEKKHVFEMWREIMQPESERNR